MSHLTGTGLKEARAREGASGREREREREREAEPLVYCGLSAIIDKKCILSRDRDNQRTLTTTVKVRSTVW